MVGLFSRSLCVCYVLALRLFFLSCFFSRRHGVCLYLIRVCIISDAGGFTVQSMVHRERLGATPVSRALGNVEDWRGKAPAMLSTRKI